jgi:hypothetical protein
MYKYQYISHFIVSIWSCSNCINRNNYISFIVKCVWVLVITPFSILHQRLHNSMQGEHENVKLNRACSNMGCPIFSLPTGTPCKLVNDNCGISAVHIVSSLYLCQQCAVLCFSLKEKCVSLKMVAHQYQFLCYDLFSKRLKAIFMCYIQNYESELCFKSSTLKPWTVLSWLPMQCYFFAWSVNKNMLPVTLNHVTQKKKLKILSGMWV